MNNDNWDVGTHSCTPLNEMCHQCIARGVRSFHFNGLSRYYNPSKPQSDDAPKMSALFGEDYNMETADTTTELKEYCQDRCPYVMGGAHTSYVMGTPYVLCPYVLCHVSPPHDIR